MRQSRVFSCLPMLAVLWFLILLTACSDGGSSGSVSTSGSSGRVDVSAPSGSSEANPPSDPDPGENPPVLETAGPGSALLPPDRLSITSPVRLAAYNDSAILVSDYNTNKVLIVDKATLRPLAGFNLFRNPSGVAFSEDTFFVGNQSTGSVDVFDATSKFLYYLGGNPGEFLQVNDLAVDATTGIVYVLDTKAAVIRLYNIDGTYTGRQIGAGTLKQPTAMTLNIETGRLFVSDFGDLSTGVLPAIRIFDILDPSGAQIDILWGGLKKISMMGTIETTRFSTPQGVWADSAYVFVADALSGEIHIYKLADKSQVKVLGQIGSDLGDLHYPLDVFVDSGTRDVFVADNGNGRITVFRGGGVIP